MDHHFLDYPTPEIVKKFWQFYLIYQQRPIAINSGGIKIEHMFALWFILTELKPEVVIESGLWYGQSSWLIEQAVPEARIIGLDPILRPQRYIPARADFSTLDFCRHDWARELGGVPPEAVVCFFDDHHGMTRLFQARESGFRHVIYEDNFAHPGGNFNHDFSPKWILMAYKYQNDPERLCRGLIDFSRRNPAYAKDVLASAERFSSPDGVRRYEDCVGFFENAVNVYCEFPPLLPLDPTRIDTSWPDSLAAEIPPPVFQQLDLPLSPSEFDYNFIAYLDLRAVPTDQSVSSARG